MSTETNCCSMKTLNWLGAIGAVAAMAVLVGALRHYARRGDVNAARAAERHKILAEARQKSAAELATFGVIDKEKGVYRLANDRAMELAVRAWQNPVEARKELLARAEKAFYVPPPPPEPKSAFE